MPLGAVIGGVTYMSYLAFCPCAKKCNVCMIEIFSLCNLPCISWFVLTSSLTFQCNINEKIEKNNAKVVHSVDVEDLGETSAFCRCWKSKIVSIDCFFYDR